MQKHACILSSPAPVLRKRAYLLDALLTVGLGLRAAFVAARGSWGSPSESSSSLDVQAMWTGSSPPEPGLTTHTRQFNKSREFFDIWVKAWGYLPDVDVCASCCTVRLVASCFWKKKQTTKTFSADSRRDTACEKLCVDCSSRTSTTGVSRKLSPHVSHDDFVAFGVSQVPLLLNVSLTSSGNDTHLMSRVFLLRFGGQTGLLTSLQLYTPLYQRAVESSILIGRKVLANFL